MQGLVARARGIVVAPHTEWPAIGHESAGVAFLLTRYVALLAAIPALARFIGGSLIGGYTPVLSGLIGAIVAYLWTFIVVYVVALLVDALAPTFGARKSFPHALKLTAYAFTPAWLAGVFLAVPGLSFLGVLGLYGFYLMWIGLPVLMQAPRERSLSYVAVVVAWAVVLDVLGRTLLAVLTTMLR
ncbi:MAG: Yip1 family protein [Xanthobacteraceae bacterium]